MPGTSIGAVIWYAVKPIIKIYLIIGSGIFLSKRNILTVEAAKTISDIVLTLLLPCLIFNKIVSNIDGSDLKGIGLICLTCFMVFSTGCAAAILSKLLTPVPRKWIGGLFAGGIFTNFTDIPIAYIQSLDVSGLFTDAEGEKGVAHVCIALAMFNLCLFNFGGFRLIEHDFKEKVDLEKQSEPTSSEENDGAESQGVERRASMEQIVREYSGVEPVEKKLSRILTSEVGVLAQPKTPFVKKYHLGLVIYFLENCLRPCAVATIISLVIVFIPWLKGLFVHNSKHIANAPDGLPPLDFLLDYTAYIGAASIPFSLCLLGASISRLSISTIPPGFWKCALLLVVLRLGVMPIIGVLWIKRLVKSGLIDKSDNVLQFVLAMLWGLPSATMQIFFTAFYTPLDSTDRTQMNCVSLYMLIQYPILVVSLPILVTYVFKNQLGY